MIKINILQNQFLKGFLLLFLISFSSCKSNVTTSQESVEKEFQKLLDEMIASNMVNIQGVSLSVFSPSLDIDWSGVSGVSDVKNKTPLVTNQPFRVASITKTFVAAAILVLDEKDSLSIQDPLSKYISNDHLKILKEGGYDPTKITIQQCLAHTSGLYDYALGGETYLNIIQKNPNKRWTRTEQLESAMMWGKPYGKPGEVFHYSDSGYILLGEILEKMTQKNLGGALRQILDFEKNNLDETWLESLDEIVPTKVPQIKRYFRGKDFSDWDNSIDLYGGGGLVATTDDLALFFYQIFNGKIYSKDSTLETMLKKQPTSQALNQKEKDYRLGLQAIKIYEEEVFMHSGFWGSFAVYFPKYKTAIGLNFTKDEQHAYAIKKIVAILEEVSK